MGDNGERRNKKGERGCWSRSGECRIKEEGTVKRDSEVEADTRQTRRQIDTPRRSAHTRAIAETPLCLFYHVSSYPILSCLILFCSILSYPSHPVPTFVVFFELLEGYESVPRPVPLLHEVQVRLFLRQLSCNGESVWIADNCYGEV